MTTRSARLRKTALAAMAAPVALGAAVVAPAQTAEAHSHVGVTYQWRDTSDCPCYLGDEYDGTYFAHDPGSAEGAKARIYSKGQLVGKMEFHPYGEKFWVYDTKANGDAIYYRIKWGSQAHNVIVPSGKRVASFNYSIPEGTKVLIEAYDNPGHKNRMAHAYAYA